MGNRLAAKSATETEIRSAISQREIVRTWPMRGTLHFVAPPDVRWMLALLTPRIIARSAGRQRQLELTSQVFAKSRKRLIKALEGGKQLARDEIYATLNEAGISTRGQRGLHILWRLAQEGPLHANKILSGNNGMFMPTILINGRIAGIWKRVFARKRVIITATPFASMSRVQTRALAEAAERCGQFVGVPVELLKK